MITSNKPEEVKKQLKTCTSPKIVLAQDDDFNRKILEHGQFDILLSIESGKRKRTLRQIDSGFNHVLAAIAHKNKIALGIDLKELSALPLQERALRLESIRQNIVICRKAKVKIVLLHYTDARGAFAFLVSLGASSAQAKEAISF